MSDKVLGNDPFAELGMEAPSIRKKNKAGSAATSNKEKSSQPVPEKIKTNTSAQKKERPAANKQGTEKKVPALKKALKSPQLEKNSNRTKSESSKPQSSTAKAIKSRKEPVASPVSEEIQPIEGNSEHSLLNIEDCKHEIEGVKTCEQSLTVASIVAESGLDPFCKQKLQTMLEIIYRRVRRVKVEGIENIPAQGRAVLVANQAGFAPIDSLMLHVALRLEHSQKRELHPLMEDFMYRLPLFGSLLSKLGMSRACPEEAARILKNDEVILLFMEGIGTKPKPYSRRHELHRFSRGGFAKLAMQLDSAIIPVAFTFSDENSNYFLPYNLIPPALHIRIGKPIKLDKQSQKASEDASYLSEIVGNLRTALENMLDDKAQ